MGVEHRRRDAALPEERLLVLRGEPVSRTAARSAASAETVVRVSPVMLRSGSDSDSAASPLKARIALPSALAWAGITMPTSGICRLPSGRGS